MSDKNPDLAVISGRAIEMKESTKSFAAALDKSLKRSREGNDPACQRCRHLGIKYRITDAYPVPKKPKKPLPPFKLGL
jgi:hypothetical protein